MVNAHDIQSTQTQYTNTTHTHICKHVSNTHTYEHAHYKHIVDTINAYTHNTLYSVHAIHTPVTKIHLD